MHVLYSSTSGVTCRDQLWHQGCNGVKGALEKDDYVGSALASGDFEADGYADVAIGIPNEGVGSKSGAGAVVVLRGSASD